MELNELRENIDRLDNELINAFTRRMEVSAQIAEYKKQNSLPIYDPAREREKLSDLANKTPEAMREYAFSLYSLIMEQSKSYQTRLMGNTSALTEQIAAAIENTEKLFPTQATVACQGVEGANSELACDKLFKHASILYFSSFEAVFSAVDKGMCRYGVVPLENSTAGSVNAVYDLMMRHNFSIVKSIRLKVNHNLLAKPGTKLSDIKEIYSHEQAIGQCGEFLQKLEGVKIIPCENTAVAAKMVAQSDRGDVAALCSRSCMALYGLDCLAENVQDKGNNYTRFICISKQLEIYPGADRTSLMAVLPHEPGSLYKMLSRFYAIGVNLNKLESRPLPERNFEFMFYFDLETSVYSPEFMQLMGELGSVCEEFSYLGSYSEVV